MAAAREHAAGAARGMTGGGGTTEGSSSVEDTVLEDTVLEDMILELLASDLTSYRSLVQALTAQLQRPLRKDEKALLTRLIHGRHDRQDAQAQVQTARHDRQDALAQGQGQAALAQPEPEAAAAAVPPPANKILVISAFSSNYLVGHLTAPVNQAYAERHGYGFECEWPTLEEMRAVIAPRVHGSWFKVYMINRLLQKYSGRRSSKTSPQQAEAYTHLLWIDADAVVINHEQTVEEILQRAGAAANLVIAEDMTPCCLLNAGVMLIRICAWSTALWKDVWDEPWAAKYHSKPYYEQSALIRWLQHHGEDIGAAAGPAAAEAPAPFHSHLGGKALKRTEHLCILSHWDWNTNWGWPLTPPAAGETAQTANFIFHAVGLPKLQALEDMLRHANRSGTLPWPPFSQELLACTVVTCSELGVSDKRSAKGGREGSDGGSVAWVDALMGALQLLNPRVVASLRGAASATTTTTGSGFGNTSTASHSTSPEAFARVLNQSLLARQQR